MKNFTLSSAKSLIVLGLVFASTSALAQPWDYKMARKQVRVVKVNLLDASGVAMTEKAIQLVCNGPTGQISLPGKTDKDGSFEFKRIAQNSYCGVAYDGKILRKINFAEIEPRTTSYVEIDVKVSTNPKKELIRNQVFNGQLHRLDVYLYKNNKRKKAYGLPVAISCLGDGGMIFNETKKASFPLAKVTFENIPSGAECFVRAQQCSKEIQPVGLISFAEEDHGSIRQARMHINIPKCKANNGGPVEEEEEDDARPSKDGTSSTSSSSGSSSSSSNSGSNPSSSSDDEETDSSDDSSSSSSGKKVPASKNPLHLIVTNRTTGSRIGNQDVTIYQPATGETIAARTDRNGEALLNEYLVKTGSEYLVFLGSELQPVATLNMTSKILYTEADRSEEAPFEVGSIRHNFPQNGFTLDPSSTTISELDQLALVMKQYPGLRIVIEGYTNSDADQSYNMRLSRRRAEAIGNYLASKGGISLDRIEVKYFGESGLVQNEDGTENKEASRRVEVKPNWDTMLLK